MRKLIAINSLGYALGLDAPLAIPFRTSVLESGTYVYTLTRHADEGDTAFFACVPYINQELRKMTYQLPMPEFGV